MLELYKNTETEELEFRCTTCPYKCKLAQQSVYAEDDEGMLQKDAHTTVYRTRFTDFQRKDFLTTSQIMTNTEFKNASLTDALCPSCQHSKAFYEQRQTRSGDEGATIFYTCEKCKHVWKVDT